MPDIVNYPIIFFAVSLVVLWVAAWIGARVRARKQKDLPEDLREDFSILLAATLTLLGLIIGFSFSMATTRYDQRKNLEEEEANAIGTEYLRADLLPASDAAQVRVLRGNTPIFGFGFTARGIRMSLNRSTIRRVSYRIGYGR